MNNNSKAHSLALQYISQFDYTEKTPEEYTSFYLDVYSKIYSTLDDHDSKLQNEALQAWLDTN